MLYKGNLSKAATLRIMKVKGARYNPKNYTSPDELRRELYQFYKPEELIDAIGAILLPCGTIRKKDTRPVNAIVTITLRTADFGITFPDNRQVWYKFKDVIATPTGLEAFNMTLDLLP